MAQMSTLRVFIGFDPRQPIAYNVLQHSIHAHSSERVSIEPLILRQLPIKRRGLTEFTFSRFLVPWLCDYQGTALFLDADMLVTADIAQLFAICGKEVFHDVLVMKDQPKFEWASAMFFHNTRCKALTPDYIEDTANNPLTLDWARSVGDMPTEWNVFVGEKDASNAKLLHYSRGIPIWPETRNNPEDRLWIAAHMAANSSVSYAELMGGSIHEAKRRASK